MSARILALQLIVLLSCNATSPTLERQTRAIVGGEDEAGWPESGALTWELPGYGYKGVFCSGVLVTPQWVLTAGHCMSEVNGIPLTADMVFFYVGTDATGDSDGPGEGGPLYQADEIVQHPLYNSLFHFNDVALVHLVEPVQEAQPIALRSEPLTEDMLGEEVLFVGFGVGSGTQTDGKGHKRSGAMPISEIQPNTFFTDFAGAGVCYGDSGAPGFFRKPDGNWELIATVSGLAEEIPNPCYGSAAHSRIDYYHDWIVESTASPTQVEDIVTTDTLDLTTGETDLPPFEMQGTDLETPEEIQGTDPETPEEVQGEMQGTDLGTRLPEDAGFAPEEQAPGSSTNCAMVTRSCTGPGCALLFFLLVTALLSGRGLWATQRSVATSFASARI